ncbi:1300_t:CDS:2 [Acaulospora morrowiae]|uniref:1300_t:CDS:1 n=1 Tax=Acaulospora morrowiae TaxID=94023 RepID=A0A9N8ZBI7_9GLOM|nr:1300_t:CDS:2 [Acaulospora morrowiae]
MSEENYVNLSRDFIKFLETQKYCDLSITVGQGDSCKTFKAHSVILSARSKYFDRALSANWSKSEGDLLTFEKPNIKPEVFEIIIRYMYGGLLNLSDHQPIVILELLEAFDEFNITDLFKVMQMELIENHKDWLTCHFSTVHKVSNSHSFGHLQNFCTRILEEKPTCIFESEDFCELPQDVLRELLKRHDLQFEELDVWMHVIKWGMAQVPLTAGEGERFTTESWEDKDFSNLKERLREFLPLLKFNHIPKEEFWNRVEPFEKIFSPDHYRSIISTFFRKLRPSNSLSSPRRGPINSNLITTRHASLISSWIDFNVSDCDYGFETEDPEKIVWSRLIRENYAVLNHDNAGPWFGDLRIQGKNFKDECKSTCKQEYYEKPLRKLVSAFSVEDYEVFQIINRYNSI